MEQLQMYILYLSVVLAVFTLLIFILVFILVYRRCCKSDRTYTPGSLEQASWHLSWKDLALFENEGDIDVTETKLDAFSFCSQVCRVQNSTHKTDYAVIYFYCEIGFSLGASL